MNSKEARDKQISGLQKELKAAREISPDSLAAKILDIGFKCLHCGECCRGQDNSVVVFPFEVRSIQKATGLQWLETVAPPDEGEWDQESCFHTLEWRLAKENESCRFYQDGQCAIYPVRPMLCSTYPFYLDQGELMCSECRGLGGNISIEKSRMIADRLILRYVTEIKEAISLLDKYQDFRRGEARKGGECIVHDSEGEHRIVWQ